jgi:hypothetical protein
MSNAAPLRFGWCGTVTYCSAMPSRGKARFRRKDLGKLRKDAEDNRQKANTERKTFRRKPERPSASEFG